MHEYLTKIQEEIDRLTDLSDKSEERLQDIEIHINLLTRLITTLCVEKFGMRVGVLKRLIKRVEKEAIRDSQILHLESIYSLPVRSDKKRQPWNPPRREDPWDDIA
ncbi:MAG: hypothetical protein Q8R76_12320 [Candidatus Omnitrophota bacterium]|nr:hypothetical protein [Candidatus Omnitrophota bacterium]